MELKVNSNVPHKIYAEVVDYDTLRQFEDCLRMEGCIQGALMPDTHKGYTAPIGSVLMFKDKISPQLVGYDIGCGMCALKLDITADELDLNLLKDEILKRVPIGTNRHKNPSKDYGHEPLTKEGKKAFDAVGHAQLGTLGGGNHFIEIGTGRDGKIWIIIHSGSRGFGHKLATHHMKQAAIASIDEQRYKDEFNNNPKNKDWQKSFITHKNKEHIITQTKKFVAARNEFVYRRTRARLSTNMEGCYSLDINTKKGIEYYKDMMVALNYALANRKEMIRQIEQAIGQQHPSKQIKELELINRNHNHAEFVTGKGIIHRKGATHADDGMHGVIPGNMRDGCFIVKGLGNPESMNSSSHGAGRVLSRKKAKETLDLQEFQNETAKLVTNHTSAMLDEAPKAYKDIFEVMKLQEDLVEVIDYIIPILNIKG